MTMNSLALRVYACKVKENKKLEDKKIVPVKLPSQYEDSNDAWCLAIKNADTIPKQVEAIRNIFQNLRSEPQAIEFLADMYFYITPRHAVRSQITRLLIKAADFGTGGVDKELIVTTLSKSLQAFTETTNSLTSSEDWSDNVQSILGCMENFQCGYMAMERSLNVVFPFLYSSLMKYFDELQFISSPSTRNDFYLYIHTSLRMVVSLIQEFANILKYQQVELLKKLKEIAIDIMNESEITMDTRTAAGILLAQISKIFDVYLEFIHVAKCTKNPNEIVLCIGVVNTTDQHIFQNNSSDLRDICGNIIQLANTYATVPTVLLCAARGLNHMAKILLTFNYNTTHASDDAKLILRKELIYAFGYLPHHLDSVRNNCKEMIKNIVRVALKLKFYYLIQKIYEACNSDRISVTMKCIVLQSTGIVVGANEILKNIPGLFMEIFDTYLGRDGNANDLFLTLMNSSYQELFYDAWFQLWPQYLLSIAELHDERLPQIDELVVKAVQREPKILNYIINECDDRLPTSTTISALWAVRRAGIQLFNFGEILEEYCGDLLHSILSKSDETRLMALRLLVETNKTTEMLTQLECQHMLTYLEYNSNVQAPATRHLTLALYTKALERLNLNLKKVLKTHSPQDEPQPPYLLQFLHDLLQLFVRNLFPGANFTRRKISLQLMQQCLTICTDCKLNLKEMLPPRTITVLIDTLSDTFEANKELACKILIFIENELGERLIEDYDINISTSKMLALLVSVRPTDSVTAAYHLEFYCNTAPCTDFGNYEVLSEYRPSQYAALCWLMNELKTGLLLVQHSILQAAKYNPLYGLLLAIKHLLSRLDFIKLADEQTWRTLIAELIEICKDLSTAVATVVNNSSPEGHLPNDFSDLPPEFLPKCGTELQLNENNDNLENMKVLSSKNAKVDLNTVKTTPQMVLLCAWRTVKEVSIILGDIVLRSPIYSTTENENYLITKEQIIEIGLHFRKMLAETKHRGAFEQAYVGFSKLCTRIWRVELDDLNVLPLQWLRELMNIITIEAEQHEKLCATRRSAGVPFMVQALITTELQVGSTKALQYCMNYLLELCCNQEQSHAEARTHALNILRSLFRNTELNEAVSPFVCQGVMCALQGYDAQDWSEKNSATLLFTALMTRIFGVQHTKDLENLDIRNKMTGRIFFTCYGKLYDYFLELLQESSSFIQQQKKANKLHPLLLILNRLYPSALEGFETNLKLSVFIPFISACAGCPDMQTRLLAAKAIVSLLAQDAVPGEILRKCAEIVLSADNIKILHHNKLHGQLLQLLMLVRTYKTLTAELVGDISCTLITFFEASQTKNAVIIKTILDILIEILNWHTVLTFPQSTIQNLLYFSTQKYLYTAELSQYYPVLRKSFYIYNLHTMRLTLPYGALTDYLLSPPITAETIPLEQAETCLNIILLTLLQTDTTTKHDIEEFEFFKEELEFMQILPEQTLKSIAKELCASKQLEQTLKIVIQKPTYYPMCTMKAYAILCYLDNFDFTLNQLLKDSKKYTGELKSTIAMCIERLVLQQGVEYKLSHNCLEYLLECALPWQPDCLRIKASKILAHIGKHYPKALEKKKLTFVRMYIGLILTLLMDNEYVIRNNAADIVLDNIMEDIEMDNVVATMAQRLFLQYTADLLVNMKADDEYILEIFKIIYERFSENNLSVNIENDTTDTPSSNSSNSSNANSTSFPSGEIEVFDRNECNLFAESFKVIADSLVVFKSTFKDRTKIINALNEYNIY